MTLLREAVSYHSLDTDCRDHLTPRQFEVLGLLAKGLTSRQIAAALYIGVQTVRTHVLHKRNISS